MLGVDVVDERFIDNHSSLVGMQRTLLFLCARTVRDLCRELLRLYGSVANKLHCKLINGYWQFLEPKL